MIWVGKFNVKSFPTTLYPAVPCSPHASTTQDLLFQKNILFIYYSLITTQNNKLCSLSTILKQFSLFFYPLFLSSSSFFFDIVLMEKVPAGSIFFFGKIISSWKAESEGVCISVTKIFEIEVTLKDKKRNWVWKKKKVRLFFLVF